ncbi:MAG: GNAT family N-acetyltransferase [Bdellovibrionaceae bacterium]|nr:GNAT family N-acetyltransferase [Bdellovibrionales bacterium]MCB9253540.1 GNAT family N-acetyltransferase [Pseudobdellovibrionaceae bacterium]
MTSINLRSMSPEEFESFCTANKEDFAKQRAVTDYLSLEESKSVVEDKYKKLLPEGQATPGHYFFKGEVAGKPVGDGWIFVDASTGESFLYMIQVEPSQRGKGFGKLLLAALELHAQKLGSRVLWLNVFEDNHTARRLYESSGYRVATLHLNKRLSG